jgi:peptidoglycan/LPS O-acetylase OafA/YrhL
MTAAWLYLRLRDHRGALRSHAALAQLAAATGAIGIAYLRGWEGLHKVAGPFDHWVKTSDRTFFYGVLVLATALATSRAQWLLRNSVVRTLGVTCYGVYLVHLPVILLLIPALGLDVGTTSNTDLALLAVVAVPIAVAVGVLSYRYLEEPFRRLARRSRRADREREHTPEPVALVASSA